MNGWMARAVLRTKQALGSSPAGMGGSATSTAPAPTAAPPKLTGGISAKPPGGGLLNSAVANYKKLQAIPKPGPLPTKTPPLPTQSDIGTRASQKMMTQFNADPSSYMRNANQSGAMGGFLGAASLFNHDAVNTMLGGKNVGEQSLGEQAYGLLGWIPEINGAQNLTRPIDNALRHAWDGNWSEAGKQFHDEDYNRSMGDSSRGYFDRVGQAMDPANFYKNTTGTLGGLFQGDTWKGLGINMGLISDNNGAASG